jgi:hypothetical protein
LPVCRCVSHSFHAIELYGHFSRAMHQGGGVGSRFAPVRCAGVKQRGSVALALSISAWVLEEKVRHSRRSAVSRPYDDLRPRAIEGACLHVVETSGEARDLLACAGREDSDRAGTKRRYE